MRRGSRHSKRFAPRSIARPMHANEVGAFSDRDFAAVVQAITQPAFCSRFGSRPEIVIFRQVRRRSAASSSSMGHVG